MSASLKLYAHPFSSYCQKALIALYGNDTPFDYVLLEGEAPQRELESLWPIGKFPLLVDGDAVVFEATSIIEHLDTHHRGTVRFIPDGASSVEVRMLDRFFDNYVMTPLQKIVGDHLRPDDARDPHGVAEAHALLEKAYDWLERRLDGREWACESGFGLADCAAAPSLFYADWVHGIGDERPHLRGYRQRLLARPSVARAVDEARPYRHYFPPGAPDRD